MCLPYLHHVFMKTRKLLLLLALAAATTGMQAQRIKGSDTALPIAQQTAERFMTLTPSARVTVTGGGTGVGISALLDQTTDIAMASRAIKFSEKMKAKAAGEDLAEVPIAYDALAVVVHPSNPGKQLTRHQLEDIFQLVAGQLFPWVGGVDHYGKGIVGDGNFCQVFSGGFGLHLFAELDGAGSHGDVRGLVQQG